MRWLIFFTAMLSVAILPGCATSSQPRTVRARPTIESATGAQSTPSVQPMPIGTLATEVPVEKAAPPLPGHPLTSIVVTQCNLIVAVYMTMPDGRLLRYDHTASISVSQLLDMAYTAPRSERVEVSCNDTGAVGYERHDPV